jgi:hypothetical protein
MTARPQRDPMPAARTLPLLALALLALAPAADAYAQPVFYFLKDAPGSVNGQVPNVPSPLPLPVAVPTLDTDPGLLDPYTPMAPNAPNGTTAKSRMVPVATDTVLPVLFVTPEGHAHPDRIRGSLLVGLWTGAALTYQANLTATLYEIPAAGDPVALAEASLSLDFNQSRTPDPTVFIPPNSTDPTAIVYYELAQVYPMLRHPPALFVLGPLDVTVANGSAFGIGFRLTQGSSPAPLPAGASATVEYEGLMKPSFVYVPWYAPDPPKPTPTPRPTASFTPTGSGSGLPTTDRVIEGEGGKESPGPGVPLAVLAMAALAVAVRRRMR